MPDQVRGRLDSAIDRAVRGMMQIEPGPGLGHRVADRLDAPVRRGWAFPALMTAAAIVVLIVAIAQLRTPETDLVPEPRVATAPSAAPVVSPPSAQTRRESERAIAAAEPGEAGRVRPRPAGSIFGERTGRVSAASLTASGSEAVAAVEPPAEPPPTGTVAEIPPISIAPITVAPIRILPLTPGPVRDQR